MAFRDSEFFCITLLHLASHLIHSMLTLIALNVAPVEEKETSAGTVTGIQGGPYRKSKILQHIRLHYCLSFGSI